MRRIALAALLLASTSPVFAQGVTARVAGELTTFTGSVITIPVEADLSGAGGAKLGSYTARLQWDPAVLELFNLRAGNFVAPVGNFDSIVQGVMRFGGISATGASGSLTLGALDFTARGASTGSPLSLTFSEMSAAGTFTSLLPVTVTNGTFCTARGRWGDLDSDGFSNSRDALAVLSGLVGITVGDQFDSTLADVDGDTKVNSRDALIVLSYAVGLDISGQRVLLPAPQSGCASGSPRQITIFPAVADLTVNQPFTLLVRGTDGSGHAVSVPQATWTSSDPAVAGVDVDGRVRPRAPGTVTLTAKVGPGLQAQASVAVVARRPNWYVDFKRTGDPVQFGTAAHPFESLNPLENLPLEGDTVRVASGHYAMDFGPRFDLGMVILGGTPGDTTTRPVFHASSGSTGLRFEGGQRLVVKNVGFAGFSEAISIRSLRSLVLEDSYFDGTTPGRFYTYGVLAQCGARIDSVRIERSIFVSDSTGTGLSYDNEGCDPMGITVVRDSRFSGWQHGLQLFNVDSVAIANTVVTGNTGVGIYVGQGSLRPEALYVSHSRVEGNEIGIEVDNARRVVIDTSIIRSFRDEAIEISGVCCAQTGNVYLHGDSIYHEASSSWISATNLDSLVLDHTVLRLPADTSVSVSSDIDALHGVLNFSKFLNLGFVGQNPSQPFRFSGPNLFVDSLEVTGCDVAGCSSGEGIHAIMQGASANLTVQRSRFTRVGVAVTSTGPGVHVVRNVVIDSASTGIQLEGDSSSVTSSVLTRVFNGVQSFNEAPSTRGASVIGGNNISCVLGGTGVSFNDFGRRFLVSGDTISGCLTGISIFGVGSGTTILGAAIRGGDNGIVITHDTSTIVVDSSGVSGTAAAAILLNQGRLVATRNRIEANSLYGVRVFSSGFGVPQLHQNSFVGNATFAVFASDTVDASSNWWGAPLGACNTGADCVSGRVNVTNPLGASPGGLPGLVPAFFGVSAFRVSPAAPLTITRPAARAPAPDGRAASLEAKRLQRHRILEVERRRHHAEIVARAARERTRQMSKPVTGKLVPR